MQNDAGTITSATGDPLCTYIKIYGSNCLHCGHAIVGPVQFLAIGPPYNGVLHQLCAIHYHYNKTPPQLHPRPSYPSLMM